MMTLIFATDRNMLIGKERFLPWRLPSDLAYFKGLTLGKTVVMGRTTFEGMGKPLPGRRNLVLSRNECWQADGVQRVTMAQVIELAEKEDVFIIGGAEVYHQFWDKADVLRITRIDAAFEGDTWLKHLDFSKWILDEAVSGVVDEKNRWPHVFEVYHRA